jgi:hypothetical protein
MNSATTWNERAIDIVKETIEEYAYAADMFDRKYQNTVAARANRQSRNHLENVLTKLRMREARLRMR